MKVLIIKTSSMGDILHSLPALTDAGKAIGNISFDWVVEESFAEIPLWHPLVKNTIPVAWRRWRKNFTKSDTLRELKQFYQQMTSQHYDLVIDAQGLLKSAIITRLAKGKSYGLDFKSAREGFASFFYGSRASVSWQQHAVTRVRQLFAHALNYPLENTLPNYGIQLNSPAVLDQKNYIVLVHGTTWPTKLWPVSQWINLVKWIEGAGYPVVLPWGNTQEQQRAQQIAAASQQVHVLPKLKLAEVASVLLNAKAIVAVDTGIAHLAAALNIPTIALYGPTDPKLIGTFGHQQVHLRADNGDLAQLNADFVWNELKNLL